MRLRLSSSTQRLGVVAFALILVLFLSYFSIRNAVAVHDAELQTLHGYERATRLEPNNFRNWSLLGRYWQYNLADMDTARAIQAYTRALSLNPRSAEMWSDLAAAYETENSIPAARDAFQHAKSAYPLSAEVAWRYGNFLLRQGELDAAFLEMRLAVETEPSRGAEALSRALRAEPDINRVLDRVLPPVSDAYIDSIRDQTEEGHIANAVKLWDRLAALHPRLTLNTSFSLVDALMRGKQFVEAQRIWEQAVAFAGFTNLPAPAGSVLWDGGFESGMIGGGFAWTFPQGVRGVQIGLDIREKHSGNQSLRLVFDGKYNLQLLGPCHQVLVRPSTTYRFYAWMRTLSLTSDQGIRFQLFPFGAQDAPSTVTPEIHGTQAWSQIGIPWVSGKTVHQVQVCVVRFPSREADDRIQGVAWVDDVALIPQVAETSKP